MVLNRMRSVLLKAHSHLKTFPKHSHDWYYRKAGPPASRPTQLMATGIMGLMYWWMLWHIFTEYQHITGEWEYPQSSKWTDEELGIPPDDTDDSVYLRKREEEEVTSATFEEVHATHAEEVEEHSENSDQEGKHNSS